MTIEQQIQKAIQRALQEATAAVVIAEKIHDGDEGEPQPEQYPAVVIITSTPVPDGNKSSILRVPCFIRALSYLPESRTKEEYAELCQAIFLTLQETEDWSEFEQLEDEDIYAKISAVTIDSGEEPVIEGGGLIVQETRCTVHACYHKNIGD